MNENPDGTALRVGGRVLLAAALRALVQGKYAATSCDDHGRHCTYCGWHDEDYLAVPQHHEDCLVRRARELLARLP